MQKRVSNLHVKTLTFIHSMTHYHIYHNLAAELPRTKAATTHAKSHSKAQASIQSEH